MEKDHKIIVFQETEIRRVWHNEEWWFSVVDVIAVLTESSDPKRYWSDLKRRTEKESGAKVFAFCEPLKMQTAGGKQNVICANTEGMFRIIQSIPSPKAEPFKLWLAKVGYERIQEIENPELAAVRAKENYQALGYSEEWIERRMQSIAIRTQLTDEWKNRGLKEGQQFATLTDIITKAWAGKTTKEYKVFKGLKKENLRDNMTNTELILNMLAEASTKDISAAVEPKDFEESKNVAQQGGNVARVALKELESKTGKKVVSTSNVKGVLDIEKAKKDE